MSEPQPKGLPLNLQAARYKATNKWPYLAQAIWALQPRESEQCPTLGVDKHYRLYWNRKFVESQPVDKLTWTICHECGHLLNRHHDRMKGEDPVLSNIAGDAAINGPLKAEGADLPDGCIYPSTLGMPDGLLAEEYLDNLKKNAKTITVKSPGCGSCSHGGHEEWEEGEPTESGEGVGEVEKELIRRAVAEDVKKASQSRGDVPGSWTRWAEDVLAPPKINWRHELSRLVRGTVAQVRGMVDLSRRKVSRRQWRCPEIVLPGWVKPGVNAAIVGDVSGSMSEALPIIRSEVEGITQALGVPVTWVACDTEVTDKRKITSVRNIKQFNGWGGTDMRVGIERAVAERPDVIIVITDGFTPWPDEAPRAKVIVVVAPHGTVEGVPTWAVTLKIEEM